MLKPRLTAQLPALRQRRITPSPGAWGVQPSCGIAETFADIVSGISAGLLPNHGRLSQFATCLAAPLFRQKRRVTSSFSISQTHPSEMKNFVHQDQRQVSLVHQLAFEHNFTPPDEACRVHRCATIRIRRKQLTAVGGQQRQAADEKWAADQGRQLTRG